MVDAPRTPALEWVHDVAPQLAARAAEIERTKRLPPEVLDLLHEGGMFRLLLPRWLDGAELGVRDFALVMEALAAVDASTAWCVCQAAACAMAAAYVDRESAVEVFGAPRSVLAWGPDTGTHAVVVDGGYVVSGRWSYVSGIHHATWLGGSCRLFEPDGTPRRTAAGAQEIRTVLFPAEHATVEEVWDTLGLRGTGTDSFTVTDLFVPDRLSFARDDPSAWHDPASLYCFSHSNVFSAGFAAVVLGIARGALDAFVALARDKTPLGRERALRDSPPVQMEVARLEGRLRAARAFLFSVLDEAWHEATGDGALSDKSKLAIRLAASHAFAEAPAILDRAYHGAGITAVFTGSEFERRLRDLHTATQQFQGRDEHFETVGRSLLGTDRA